MALAGRLVGAIRFWYGGRASPNGDTPTKDTTMPPTDLTHAQKHGPKYFLAGALALVVTVLQVFGTLSPIICAFVPKADTCKQVGIAATVAAQELDKIQLDDGSELPLKAVYNDGGE